MDFLGLTSASYQMAALTIVVLSLLGWVLGKLNALIERRMDLTGKLMAVPALIAAAGVASYLGYYLAVWCSANSLDEVGGKLLLLIFISLCLSCAWRARQIAVILGYVAVVVVAVGNVYWWVIGGD